MFKKWNKTRKWEQLNGGFNVCVYICRYKDMRRSKRGACTVILTDYITGLKRMRELFKLNKKRKFFGNDWVKSEPCISTSSQSIWECFICLLGVVSVPQHKFYNFTIYTSHYEEAWFSRFIFSYGSTLELITLFFIYILYNRPKGEIQLFSLFTWLPIEISPRFSLIEHTCWFWKLFILKIHWTHFNPPH